MLNKLIRFLFSVKRVRGDARAASRGPGALGKRTIKRKARRAVMRKINKW
ncbi:hypothetical protein [Bacillus sp. FJAT-44742]|nr:hypothetical protein [Bacillus sp. FJAT-44742]